MGCTRYENTIAHQTYQFLLNSLNGLVNANDVDAWQEEGTLILNSADKGNGLVIAKWRYKATIEFERFPHKKINPYSLLAMIACYLSEHDPETPSVGTQRS